MTLQQLVIEFTSRFDSRGVSQLLDGMRNVRTETEGVISTMNRLGAVFTAVTGAATIAFKNYEFSLTEFAGKAMKTTEDFGTMFSKVSGEIARSTGLARAEVLRGLQEGTSAQLPAILSADLTKKAAILGAGRQSLMRQTVNVALSGYRNAFGDPGKVLDYVYASAQLGQGQVPEFAPAAQYVFPFARGAGIGLSEVAAGLSAISTTAPSPLMGSTQFGAFLTGVARGSTYEDMLKEKTGGKSSQDIRDMLRNEGLARTTSFLSRHFNGDELQQVYGRKELVQFVQGVTGQPGLLARLEQMITKNAESGPIERFGDDLENTLQNQFDRLIQSITQLGAEFGKPMGELAKLILKLTRGSIDLLTSINQSLGGALAYLFTIGGSALMIQNFPLLGPALRNLAGAGARKWTGYLENRGIDQSGFWGQLLMQFGAETAAGGVVMGGYNYIRERRPGTDPLHHQRSAHAAMKDRRDMFYQDLIESGYSEAEARRMSDVYYEKGEEYYQNHFLHAKSVGAAAVRPPPDDDILDHEVYWDKMAKEHPESKFFNSYAKRVKTGDSYLKRKNQWPKWSDYKEMNDSARAFMIQAIGPSRKKEFMYSLHDDLLADEWSWRNYPDNYAEILASKGRIHGPKSLAEENFIKAYISGEVELHSQTLADVEEIDRKTFGLGGSPTTAEEVSRLKKRAADWRANRIDIINQIESGIKKSPDGLFRFHDDLKGLAYNKYLTAFEKMELKGIIQKINQEIDVKIRDEKLAEHSNKKDKSSSLGSDDGGVSGYSGIKKTSNFKRDLEGAMRIARAYGTEGHVNADYDSLISDYRQVGVNQNFSKKQREDAAKMAYILEETVKAGTYTNVFEQQKAKRKIEIEEEKKFAAEVEERYRRQQAAQRAASPPAPPPQPPSGGGGGGISGGGSSGGGGGDGPKMLFDPATGQYVFDYGTGHRWGTMPQQIPLNLTGGGSDSKLSQMALDFVIESAAFGVGAAGADVAVGKVRDKWRQKREGWWGDGSEGRDASYRGRQKEEKERQEQARKAKQEYWSNREEEVREENKKKREEQRNQDRERARQAKDAWERQRAEPRNARLDEERRRMEEEEAFRDRARAHREAEEYRAERKRDEAEFRKVSSPIGSIFQDIGSGLLGAVGFGAGGFFESRFGERFGNFKKGRFATDFGLGRAGIGIKEFFGQAKSREMPKDISKMAFFLGKMYRMATSPVGLGLTIGSLGWMGANVYVNSTQWGQQQIDLRQQRKDSIFNRDNILSFQDLNRSAASELVSSWENPGGRPNPVQYSLWADILNEGPWDGTISYFGKRWKEYSDRSADAKIFQRALNTNMPESELAKLKEILRYAGSDVSLIPVHGRSGVKMAYAKKTRDYGRRFNVQAVKVPAKLRNQYEWLTAGEVFNSTFLIDGDPNLEALQGLAESGVLEGAREQSIIERRDYFNAFPERGGESPVNITVVNNNNVNIDNATENTREIVNQELEDRDQLTVDLINRRIIRYFGRPLE